MNPKTAKGIEKYGVVWKPEIFFHPALIDLWLYAWPAMREKLGPRALSADDHMREAIRSLWPEFSLNDWSNEIIDLWCNNPIGVIWGCTSSGKSFTAAALMLADLLPAPRKTYTCLITSPMREHESRSWGKITRFYSMLPDELKVGRIKGKPDLGLHTVEIGEGERAGIHCYSTAPGEPEEDFKKRIGAHQDRNRLVCDETQKLSRSVLSAITNLGGIGEYKELHAFNPSSWFGTDGVVSEPAAPVTRKIIEEEQPDSWPLKRSFRGVKGKAIVLDGRKSPALKDPSLVGKIIDPLHARTVADSHGEDSFEYWANVIGRMPPEGAISVFVTGRDLENNGSLEIPNLAKTFHGPTIDLSGLDPSEGKDDAMQSRIRIGTRQTDQLTCIAILDCEKLKIRIGDGDVSGQIARQAVANLKNWQMSIKDFAVDCTGGGGDADTCEREFGFKGLHRVMWQGPPTKLKISASNQTADEVWNDKATQLFAITAMLAKQGRIMGITPKIAHQLTTRLKLIRSGRAKVEEKDGKDGWRARNGGESPNDLDSLICAVDRAITRKLIKPWMPVKQPQPGKVAANPFAPKQKRKGLAARMRRIGQIAKPFRG